MKVELIGIYGNDETIACSAWTSTSRKLTPAKKDRVGKLIDMLWKNGHETPMEKGIVHFLVDSEIASHIHLLKHRIASINAESARYKELKKDKYYIPEDWVGIQVSQSVEGISTDPFAAGSDSGWDTDNWTEVLTNYTELGNRLYHQCLADIEPVLGRKRAKESARFFKTYNSQIECDIMLNMRSFANFLRLRNSEHAQLEIREIAKQMKDLVIEAGMFPETLAAMDRYVDVRIDKDEYEQFKEWKTKNE